MGSERLIRKEVSQNAQLITKVIRQQRARILALPSGEFGPCIARIFQIIQEANYRLDKEARLVKWKLKN